MVNNHTELIEKFISTKSSLAIVMLVQAMISAEVAFNNYSAAYSRKNNNSVTVTMELLAHARFFSEACGWFALSSRKLRHENIKGMQNLLTENQQHINNLYSLRNSVNHHYNEDLADEYRTGNYTSGRHQENLAFIFIANLDGISFKIGTIEINMISQLASMNKIENELLQLMS